MRVILGPGNDTGFYTSWYPCLGIDGR